MSETLTHPRIGPASDLQQVHELAQQLRVDSVRASTAAGSGHPTSSMSAADLMALLLARYLRYDWQRPHHPGNDHLVFSKGHASPLLYAMFKAAGVVDDEELMTTYRRGGRLQGHPTPVLPWVDVATGSLGQGIGYAVGIALAARRLERASYRVWTLCGDSEMAEGSVWEALDKAAYYELDNFTAIIDLNRLGQCGPTEYGWETEPYMQRAAAFGATPIIIDGHDLLGVDAAYQEALNVAGPTVIIARTIKGRGFSEIENENGWHGKALSEEQCERAVAELGGIRHLTVVGPPPAAAPERPMQDFADVEPPAYRVGEKVATRKAFGETLTALGARPDVVVFDGEVGNSTHTLDFAQAHPDRFFQMYIAEQQMIASAVGFAVRGYRPFAATFAAFLTRAHDFLRMSAISRVDLRLSGSHCGVEIGADGPSQMGLEDLAMMRTLHGSTVLYPSDATSAAALTLAMADTYGISYLRTTRGSYPVLYETGEHFPIGGSRTWHEGAGDRATLVGAGVTLHECLKAAQELRDTGVPVRVVDLYSVKPLDGEALRRPAQQTGVVIVVEDHHPEGGIGDAVAHELVGTATVFAHLAVRMQPGSDDTAQALDQAGISSPHIVEAVRTLLKDGG
ncbi:MAG TPA: transketolase [Actinocrinis sp.]|nr:transketolase [Actinocrinis sp.]